MNKTYNNELSRCDEYDCKIYPCDESLEREFDEERPGTLIGAIMLTLIMWFIGASIVFGIGIYVLRYPHLEHWRYWMVRLVTKS